jgi:hypothetical protein
MTRDSLDTRIIFSLIAVYAFMGFLLVSGACCIGLKSDLIHWRGSGPPSNLDSTWHRTPEHYEGVVTLFGHKVYQYDAQHDNHVLELLPFWCGVATLLSLVGFLIASRWYRFFYKLQFNRITPFQSPS